MDALSDVFAAVRPVRRRLSGRRVHRAVVRRFEGRAGGVSDGEVPAHLDRLPLRRCRADVRAAARRSGSPGGAGEIVCCRATTAHRLCSAPGLPPTPIDDRTEAPGAARPPRCAWVEAATRHPHRVRLSRLRGAAQPARRHAAAGPEARGPRQHGRRLDRERLPPGRRRVRRGRGGLGRRARQAGRTAVRRRRCGATSPACPPTRPAGSPACRIAWSAVRWRCCIAVSPTAGPRMNSRAKWDCRARPSPNASPPCSARRPCTIWRTGACRSPPSACATARPRPLQIAFEVGYESDAAFSRAFKRSFGMTPAAWRHQHRRG